MRNKNFTIEKSFFKNLIEEAYYRKAWHGPNLHSSLKGITAEEALVRPGKQRHNIYEITVHAAYWVYRVINRISKDSGLKFPIKGSNWFESPDTLTDTEWKKVKKSLNELHDELYNMVIDLKMDGIAAKTEEEVQIKTRLLIGIAMHDVYHAGQIQLIKKLIKA